MQNKNLTFKLQWYPKIYGWVMQFFLKLFIHHCFSYYPLWSGRQNYWDTRKLAPRLAFQSLLCTSYSALCKPFLEAINSLHTEGATGAFVAAKCVWQSSDQVSTSGCCQRPAHWVNCSGLKQIASAGSEKQALFLQWEKKLWVRHLSDVFPKACKAKSYMVFWFQLKEMPGHLSNMALISGQGSSATWGTATLALGSSLWPLGKRQKLL